jgi:competence protein ComEC
VLLGVKRALGEDLERTFRETGIIHIVVLSGYNVMIVVSALTYLLTFLFFPRTRMIIGISAIFTFALLVGLSATVVRACIMAVLLLIAQTTGRTYAVLRALVLAGVVMLLTNPYLLVHDPGFQLSFLATLGLILLSPYIEKRLTRIPETLGVRGFVTATLATQLFVLPLLLYHTGLFSVVSIFVNVLVLPMVPVAMLLTFLTGTLGMVSHTLGILVGFLAHVSLAYIIKVAELFGAFLLASFSAPAFPFWVVVLAYGAMAVGIVYFFRKDGEVKATQVENDYEGWVIEEEKETPPETQSVSGGVKGNLPFR